MTPRGRGGRLLVCLQLWNVDLELLFSLEENAAAAASRYNVLQSFFFFFQENHFM